MEKKKELILSGKKYRIKETLQAIYSYQRELNKKDNKEIGDLEKEILMIYHLLKEANRIQLDDYDKFTLSWDDFNDLLIENMDSIKNLSFNDDEIDENVDGTTPTETDDNKKK